MGYVDKPTDKEKSMTDMITLRGIGKRFGKTEVLRDLDLTVDRFLANYYGAVVCTV